MSRGETLPNHTSGHPADSRTTPVCALGPGVTEGDEGGEGVLVSDYCFWGVGTRVYFTRAKDREHYDYYFQDHRPGPALASPAYEVFVEAKAGDDVGRARVLLREPGKAWSELNDDNGTPLPPFQLPPLSTRVRTVHASAAHLAHGSGPHGTLVLHGPSTSGKSIILLELLREGWEFVTDDTLVIQDGRLILRYCRPIGVRSRTLRRLSWLRQHLDKARRFNTPTGVTHAVHPYDLGVPLAAEETPWIWTVLLHRSNTFAVHPRGENTLRIDLNVDRHLEKAVRSVTEWVKGTSKDPLERRSAVL